MNKTSLRTKIAGWLLKKVWNAKMPVKDIVVILNRMDGDKDGCISVGEVVEEIKRALDIARRL